MSVLRNLGRKISLSGQAIAAAAAADDDDDITSDVKKNFVNTAKHKMHTPSTAIKKGKK